MNRIFAGLGASASAVYASTYISTAHAAAPTQNKPQSPSPPPTDKLAIYDDEASTVSEPLPGTVLKAKPEDDTLLAEYEAKLAQKLEVEDVKAQGRVYKVSKLLQNYIGSARETLNRQLALAETKSEELGHAYRQSERNAAETVASLKSEREELLPQSIYVLIAGLSGSIFARRRNILLRATVPWLFGGAAFAYFLPETWSNVRKLAWHHEKEQFPTLAKKHIAAQQSIEGWTRESTEFLENSKQQVKSAVNQATEQVREWIGK